MITADWLKIIPQLPDVVRTKQLNNVIFCDIITRNQKPQTAYLKG